MIKILCWNCNSIKNKHIELSNYMYLNNIDIVGLNETKLDRTVELIVPGYSIYRNDRDSRGGGVAVLIKKSIKHYFKPTKLKNIEAVTIMVNTEIGELKIVTAYLPPDKKLLKDDLNEINNYSGSYIIMGDLNARNTAWNCITSNDKGNKLLEFCVKNKLSISAPEKATHYPKRGLPSIIDVFLMKNIINFTEASSLPIFPTTIQYILK